MSTQALPRDVPTTGTAPTTGTPLSFNQELFVLLGELSPEGGGDLASQNALRYAEVRGPLDCAALRTAMDVVAQRHDSLRTRFVVRGSTWEQVVEPFVAAPLTVVDLTETHADSRDRLQALRAHAHGLHHQALALDRTPLWDVTAFTLKASLHVLQIRMHHLIADMHSAAVVHHELDVEYRRALGHRVPSLRPAVQYETHRTTQHERLDRFLEGGRNVAEWRQIVAYRKDMLFGLRQAARMVLMTFATGPGRSGTMPAREFAVGRDELRGLRRTARRLGVTESTVCLAAWHRALRHWCRQERLVVWSEKSLRPPGCAGVVGTFADATVFVTDVDPEGSFADLVADLNRQQQAYLRSDGMLVAGVHADPSLLDGHGGLFGSSDRVFYQFLGQPPPWPPDAVLQPTDLVEPYDFQDGAMDLHCCLISGRERLRIRLRWDDGSLDDAAVSELGDRFVRELGAANSPGALR